MPAAGRFEIIAQANLIGVRLHGDLSLILLRRADTEFRKHTAIGHSRIFMDYRGIESVSISAAAFAGMIRRDATEVDETVSRFRVAYLASNDVVFGHLAPMRATWGDALPVLISRSIDEASGFLGVERSVLEGAPVLGSGAAAG